MVGILMPKPQLIPMDKVENFVADCVEKHDGLAIVAIKRVAEELDKKMNNLGDEFKLQMDVTRKMVSTADDLKRFKNDVNDRLDKFNDRLDKFESKLDLVLTKLDK